MQEPWAAITSAASTLQVAASRDRMQVQRSRIHGVDSLICRAAPAGKLTKLHLFMMIGLFPPGYATRELVGGFLKDSIEYSVRNKGGMVRGAQTGTATVGVVLTDRMTPDASSWAEKPRGSRFAALGYPVSVELAEGRVTHPKRIIVGAVYSGAMKRFVTEHVTDVLFPTGPASH